MPNMLAELTDQLNEKIRDIERGLEALGLGVTALVPLPGPWTARALEFGKRESAWRLTVTFQDGSETPLLNASRGIRCAAMSAIPAVLEAMQKQVANDIEQVETALRLARAFLTQIGAGGVHGAP